MMMVELAGDECPVRWKCAGEMDGGESAERAYFEDALGADRTRV
jgi:hypothetical protein